MSDTLVPLACDVKRNEYTLDTALTRGRIDHFSTKNSSDTENICRCYLFTVLDSDLLCSRQCLCFASYRSRIAENVFTPLNLFHSFPDRESITWTIELDLD